MEKPFTQPAFGMNFTVRELINPSQKDRQKYDNFVKNHPLGSIHQTLEWGLFQCKTPGRDKFYALMQEDQNGNCVGSVLLIRQQLPKGLCWLYAPRGPLIDYADLPKFAPLFQKIAEIAKKDHAVFLRFYPGIPDHHTPNFKSIKSRLAHAHYQPESTLILDLTKSLEELLKQMKPKGRYNIKIAHKHGVKIRQGDPGEVHLFYDLLLQTTTRDKFSGHALEYYQNMLAVLGPQQAKLYFAEYDSKIIAGMIVTYFKDTATYYFGASSNEYRNTMAPYLLQWQAILDAKSQGLKFYDFLGIAPQNQSGQLNPNHPWAGVTDFKLKFGGERLNYISPQEIVYKPLWYNAIKIAKKLRR